MTADLDRWRDAVARAGANLLALEQDPTVALLDAAPLAGASAERWAAGRVKVAELFELFSALGDVVEQAAATAAQRGGAAAAAALLSGPSVVVTGGVLTIADRGLLAGSRPVERWTPDEALARMVAGFDEVRAMVAAAAHAWEEMAPAIASRRQRLAELEGRRPGTALAEAGALLDDLARSVLTDPLAVDPDVLEHVDRLLDATVARADAADAHRDELRGRLHAYHAKADDHGLLEDGEVAELYDRARAALRAPDLDAAAELVGRYQRAVNAAGEWVP